MRKSWRRWIRYFRRLGIGDNHATGRRGVFYNTYPYNDMSAKRSFATHLIRTIKKRTRIVKDQGVCNQFADVFFDGKEFIYANGIVLTENERYNFIRRYPDGNRAGGK